MKAKNRIYTLLAFVFLFTKTSSIAHEQKTALTDIFLNERTGNLEIAHRISLHDAEHLARKVTGRKDDLTKSENARKRFARYVAEHFSLFRADESAIELDLVGEEIDGGYLWVYQEVQSDAPGINGFSIENSILLDVVKGQTNTVNIRESAKVTTLVFRSGSNRQIYTRQSGD